MYDLSWLQSNGLVHDVVTKWDPYEFKVLMNRQTAAARGLRDGQAVWVESPYGRTQGELRLTETVHPEVVGFPAGLRRYSTGLNPITRKGSHFNSLVPIDGGTFEPMTGGLDHAVKVKVYSA